MFSGVSIICPFLLISPYKSLIYPSSIEKRKHRYFAQNGAVSLYYISYSILGDTGDTPFGHGCHPIIA
jgi:hypothetical protein